MAQEIDYIRYRPMCNYCAQGKWELATQFADSNPTPNPWNTIIDSASRSTALCVAAVAGQTNFIKNLVNEKLSEDDLLVTDSSDFTALHNVATNGNKEAAEILVGKNPRLTQIRYNEKETPLLRAAVFGHEELFRFLLRVTKDEDPSPFRGRDGATLLVTVIDANLYDVALDLVNNYEEIATTRAHTGRSAIQALATKSWPSNITQSHNRPRPSANSMLGTWDKVCENVSKHLAAKVPSLKIKHANKLMYGKYLELVDCILDKVEGLNDAKKMIDLIRRTVLDASEHGNVDFIKSIISIDHNRITDYSDTSLSILHSAIKHRQKEVFYYLKNLGYKDELALRKDDLSKETILHLAAKLAPTHKLEEISGAALQVQYEIHWYKEVEKIVQPFYRDRKNSNEMSPRKMFSEEHKDLVKKGEEWMKHMASSSMLVSTLIATVVFAAAFTVPGGNNQDKGSSVGMPIFLNERAYMVFAVSNALAFFSSLTSVLMFLSILTARYAEEDFLRSLPLRLIIGLAMLFIATATMGMAFIATYFLTLGHKRAWIAILMAVLTCVPVALFVFLQFRLFVGMIKSTYRSTL